jgi:His-Xaa-Ser system protein HxsD
MARNELNFEKKGDSFLIYVNPKTVPLEVVYSAAYVFLDKAYIVIDGNPDKEIIVKIRPKKEADGEKLPLEFNNELVKYCEYKANCENNKELRQIILQRALLSNDPASFEDINGQEGAGEKNEDGAAADEDGLPQDISDLEDDDEDFLDDPEGIAIPWEEKYGKDAKKSRNPKKTAQKKSKKSKK